MTYNEKLKNWLLEILQDLKKYGDGVEYPDGVIINGIPQEFNTPDFDTLINWVKGVRA